MSNTTKTGVCDKDFSYKKVVCDQCGVCRYCDAPPCCQLKINHKHVGIHIQSKIEQKKIRLNRTTIYGGRYRMNLTDELYLFDDGNVYQKEISCFKLVSYLGLNPKLSMRYPINVVIYRIVKQKEENLCDPIISSNNFT